MCIIAHTTKSHALSAHMQSDTQWYPGLHKIIQLCSILDWEMLTFSTMQCKNGPLLACHWWRYKLWIDHIDSKLTKQTPGVYLKSFIAKRLNSILVNLRYLRFKLLKYKENNKKICNTFDHNFKNIPLYIMRKVSLERYYFVLYDCALTSKMAKMALKSFCDKTLHLVPIWNVQLHSCIAGLFTWGGILKISLTKKFYLLK